VPECLLRFGWRVTRANGRCLTFWTEIQGRVDANRRFVDEVLEEIQDQNRYSTFKKSLATSFRGQNLRKKPEPSRV
jgi:hypothetical protein